MSAKPNNYSKGLPGIPLASLDAIQDENTRQVLRAIVDGWHVRNGSSGDGKSRFVTASEFGDLSGIVGSLGKSLSSVQQEQATGKPMTTAQISRIITDLQASVMESQLFKELGDRITLINQDFLDGLAAEAIARQAAITTEATTRQTADTSLAQQITTITAAVNSNAAAIQTEITARANGDNAVTNYVNTQLTTVNGNLSALQTQQTTTANNVAALSSSVSTLQVTVGQNTSAIQTEATTRANADNDMYAKYSVKIDQNGYVSGYGLMSTANNSTPYSEFIVRANSFAIGSPSGPGITPVVPFIVKTTTTPRPDGTSLPAGVYMSTAVVKDLYGSYIEAGYFRAGNIYIGNGNGYNTSRYIDNKSNQTISAVASTTWSGSLLTGYDATSGQVPIFTDNSWSIGAPDFHASVPVNQRVRNTNNGVPIPIFVTVTAMVDHWFSLWYRRLYSSGAVGGWVHVIYIKENGPNYSSVTITYGDEVYLTDGEAIQFGISASRSDLIPHNSWAVDITDYTCNIQAVNL